MILNCLSIILILVQLALMFAIFFYTSLISRILLILISISILMLKVSLTLHLKRLIVLINSWKHLMHRTLHINLIAHLTRLRKYAFRFVESISILIEKSFVHLFEQTYLISYSKNELIRSIWNWIRWFSLKNRSIKRFICFIIIDI
jgi:c-di-AMP phosphodiesterase-like protein